MQSLRPTQTHGICIFPLPQLVHAQSRLSSTGLEQGWAHHGSSGQIWLTAYFVNKVLLAHSHAYLFTFWLLSSYKLCRVEQLQQKPVDLWPYRINHVALTGKACWLLV